MLEKKVETLLEEKYQDPEFQDCFTVDIKLSAARKLEIFIDSDSGMDFTKCRRISRYLETVIDEENWLGEKYTLEVSSPGLTRPLKFRRQYLKNIGRKLDIQLLDKEKISGTLLTVGEEDIVIEEKARVKEGKKKKMITREVTVMFKNIKETKIKISFN